MHPPTDNPNVFTYAWGKEGNGLFGPTAIGLLLLALVGLIAFVLTRSLDQLTRWLLVAMAIPLSLLSAGLFLQAWQQRHSQERRITVDLDRRTVELVNCTLHTGFIRTRTIDHCVLTPDDIRSFTLDHTRVNRWLKLQTPQGLLLLISNRDDLQLLHHFLLDLTGPRPLPLHRRPNFQAFVLILIGFAIFGVLAYLTI